MPNTTTELTLREAVETLETLYPLKYAESWDEPGLIVGDPSWPVRKIYCAVDPTRQIVREAIEWGADLLVTHHPLFFRAVHNVSGMGFRGGIVNDLIANHCALWVGHTNADSAWRGTSHALADALGLVDDRPLVPIDDPDAEHPVGMGRVGSLKEPMSLEAFAKLVAHTLPPTRFGVMVSGDPAMRVRRVAVMGGSGDSFFDEVRAAGVDVYVTSDLRHHPVVDARQQAEYEAVLAGGREQDGVPAMINTPHYASEKMLFRFMLDDVPAAIEARTGAKVEMVLSPTDTDPWTLHVPSPSRRH